MKHIKLFGQGTQALAEQITSQNRVNCFLEKTVDGDKSSLIIRGTPGLSIWTTTPNNKPVRGWFTASDSNLYIVADTIVYKVDLSGAFTQIGTINSANTPVSINQNNVQLIIVDGIGGWIYTFATGTFVAIGFGMVLGILTAGTLYTNGTYTNVSLTGGTGTGAKATIVVSGGSVTSVTLTAYGTNYIVGDSLTCPNTSIGGTGSGWSILVSQSNLGFPAGATTVSYLDGYFICEFPNSIQWGISNINDGTNWQALQFASATSNPSLVNAIDALNGNIILWKTAGIEFWQDAGSFPFPMQRLTSSSLQYGLGAKWSRATVGDSICFLGQTQQGTRQIYQMIGTTIVRISNHNIEHLISGFSFVSDAVGFSYIVDGHFFYQITFPTANKSFLYDTITKVWSTVQTGIEPGRHQANNGIVFNGTNYISDYATGNIYQQLFNTYDEEGLPILREVDSIHINTQGNEFSISELWIDFETGTGLQQGQGFNPQLMMQVSKDGGRTFGSPRTASIGKVGQYRGPRVIFRRLGSGRDFVFKFTMTDPVPFIIIDGSATIIESNQG
jgi:hypothetical protein